MVSARADRLASAVVSFVVCERRGYSTFNFRRRFRNVAEALFHSRQHDVTHDIAAMTTGRRRLTHGLTVAAIEREGHAQRLAIVTAKLEAVRTPSLVAPRYSHFAVVSALDVRPRRPVQQQVVHAHHAIHTFGVDRGLASGLPLASQQAPYAPIAVAWQVGNKQSNCVDKACVVRLASASSVSPISWSRELCRHIRARYTENIANPLRCVSSGNEGERAIHFRDFITSTASRRISFSMVFIWTPPACQGLLLCRTDTGCGFISGPCRSKPAGPNGIR
ncbi:hypothetical protein X946_56 [Burkholderia sp. ABCPW 111]|nr:hypothetical protein X946_56 [Burkholderia sp. ABCPW 111]